ncbi:hypothetical protein SAMN05428949_6474 [Chitinophaga sp. YR627]|uniref:hypothetical protein n=1 Tax=Chitinophaga sp. YR627 TaxID=1881041 RepID=UPI0008E89E5F|nr:hypothetical protein [Chitinophaga sp. YR627]SFO75155.1 hypothetical protein SAMN05428949_6474 [Chitinophaga sp. YR627]
MADIKAIIKFLDDYLSKNNLSNIRPVEANELLEKQELLNDSKSRKGKPLRDLLRAGKIPHAYQTGGKNSRWFIPHSNR